MPDSEAWHIVGEPGEPPFLNGWLNVAPGVEARAAFYRDPLGIVRLKGAVFQLQPSGATVFVLPEAYRPDEILKFVTACSCIEPAQIRILLDGSVFASGPSQVNLEGIAFRVEE